VGSGCRGAALTLTLFRFGCDRSDVRSEGRCVRESAYFFPADQRVADALAEATNFIHAQHEALHDAMLGSPQQRSGFGLNAQR